MAIKVDEKKVISRMARKEIVIPKNVSVELKDNLLTVKGTLGTLSREINPIVKIEISETTIKVNPSLETMKRTSESKVYRAMTGTFYSHINNMLKGVTEGFSKNLLIVGVGYRAALKGKTLNMQLGYAHEVNVEPPKDITFEVPTANKIVVKGIDKEAVGHIAANIRKWREPLVYGGKGIRYENEKVRIKVGKKA